MNKVVRIATWLIAVAVGALCLSEIQLWVSDHTGISSTILGAIDLAGALLLWYLWRPKKPKPGTTGVDTSFGNKPE